jgi:sarcosine oxidase
MIGKPESDVIKGTLKSINTYDLPHTIYSAEEMKSRYPRFHLEADDMAIYEDNAGYLYPELCIETYVTMAKASSHHLDVHHGEKLISYNALVDRADGSETIEVLTSKGRYQTKKIILTIGAWAPEIYGGDLPWKLSLERRVLYWFEPTRPADLALEKSFQVRSE